MKEATLDVVREMILKEELGPRCERVSEATLAVHLSFLRTTVRSPLTRLADEGCLAVRTEGFVVATFSMEEINAAFDLRALLHAQATRQIALRGADASLLAQLDAGLAEGDPRFDKPDMDPEDELNYGLTNAPFQPCVVRGAVSKRV